MLIGSKACKKPTKKSERAVQDNKVWTKYQTFRDKINDLEGLIVSHRSQ